MLWRLFNSGNGIERYKHGDEPAWALVTGSSDGIGKGIAAELLSRGFNVFLHGRNAEKLATVKEELLKASPERSVEVIVADATEFSPAQMDGIVKQIEGRNLTVLVNNLAWTGLNFDAFEAMDYDTLEAAFNINIRFFTHLTRKLLPILSTHEPALIMNISSWAAKAPLGYLSVYSGTKAYLVAFSRALVQEFAVESRKIEVIVETIQNAQSSGNKSPEAWHTPSVKTMATSIVNSVGKAGKNVVVTPYWGHELIGILVGPMSVYALGKMGTKHLIDNFIKKK